MSRSTRAKPSPSAAKPKASPAPSRSARKPAAKPSSPAPQQSRVKDVYTIVESESLESRLIEIGYLPQGKVVVGDVTMFVRVLDNNCNSAYVFIDGDMPGYVASTASDAATEEHGESGLLPLSMKQGLAAIVGQDLYGVALECEDSVVTLRREYDGSLVEHRYRFNVNDDARAHDGFLLLPIIRMSDLLGNPEESLASLARAVVVLDQERFAQMTRSLETMAPDVLALQRDFERCRETLGNLYPAITGTLQELYTYNQRFLEMPPADDEAKDKYQDVRFNIAVRRDYLATLFRCMSMVEGCRVQVQAAAALMEEALDCCNEKIVSVDAVIPRPRA